MPYADKARKQQWIRDNRDRLIQDRRDKLRRRYLGEFIREMHKNLKKTEETRNGVMTNEKLCQ